MTTARAAAANRFGLGARPGDLARIARPRAWLLEQLEGPSRTPQALRDLPSSATVLVEARDLLQAQRAAKRSGGDADRSFGRTARDHYMRQVAARYQHAVTTDLPFIERLVHFWGNHFAVSVEKRPLAAVAGLFENEAIRPNVGGRFADLLLAVEQHPAMIIYLDNQRSVGTHSKLGRRANRRAGKRQVGLNENLAREILELHTLGVDGGYSQKDVTSFAEVITGWSVGGVAPDGRFASGKPGKFEFRELIHEPGPKSVMGRTYQDDGLRQGEAVLRDLASHPSTASFVCEKLARHFIADEPPPQLLDRLTHAWLDSDGNLPIVYRAMVESGDAWSPEQRKYKTPHDFVVSTLRAFGHVPDRPRFVAGALDLMGQAPFRPGSPEGWPDTAEQWGGADALYKRIEWSNQVARLIGSRIDAVGLGDAVLGAHFKPETRRAVRRAENRVQAMTLFLASPDFQRR